MDSPYSNSFDRWPTSNTELSANAHWVHWGFKHAQTSSTLWVWCHRCIAAELFWSFICDLKSSYVSSPPATPWSYGKGKEIVSKVDRGMIKWLQNKQFSRRRKIAGFPGQGFYNKQTNKQTKGMCVLAVDLKWEAHTSHVPGLPSLESAPNVLSVRDSSWVASPRCCGTLQPKTKTSLLLFYDHPPPQPLFRLPRFSLSPWF